jgi:uncharacterized protein (UPF0218 family)
MFILTRLDLSVGYIPLYVGGCQKIKTNNILTLTPQLRQELKNPLGMLIEGPPKKTMEKIKQLIQKQKPTKTISVGDIVTQNLAKNHIPLHIMIIDNKVLRQIIQPIKADAQKILHVKNPPGTITPEAWTIVQQALEQNQTTKLLVDGEEDLLTLVAVIQAPANSLVIYGQPHEGIVAIKVTAQTKKKMQKIIDAMQPAVEKSK